MRPNRLARTLDRSAPRRVRRAAPAALLHPPASAPGSTLAFAFAFGLACACALLGAAASHAEDDAGPSRLSEHYRLVARLSVPVEEISGWAPLPGERQTSARAFLAVSDEGTWHASDRTVRGALVRMSFRVAEESDVALEASRAVTLHVGDLIPRLDPAWTQGHSLLDLEACVPLPGTPDLFLLAGERNPEDASDGGANRLESCAIRVARPMETRRRIARTSSPTCGCPIWSTTRSTTASRRSSQ